MVNLKETLEPKYQALKETYPELKLMTGDQVMELLSDEEYAVYISGKLNKWMTKGRINKVCSYWQYATIWLQKESVTWDNIPEYCRHVLFGARYYVSALNDVKKAYKL